MAGIAYSVRIYKHGDKRRGQVDEAILQRLLQGDLGLHDLARRLLRRHDGNMERECVSACGLYLKTAPSSRSCSDCATLPRLSAPTWGSCPGGVSRQKASNHSQSLPGCPGDARTTRNLERAWTLSIASPVLATASPPNPLQPCKSHAAHLLDI